MKNELDFTAPWVKIGDVEWKCDCPSPDGSWFRRQHTDECRLALYTAEAKWVESETVRRNAIPRIALIADIVENVLSGQYGRDTALDIAEEILEMQANQNFVATN